MQGLTPKIFKAKMRKTLLYEKGSRKMLKKSTMQRSTSSFARADPKSAKLIDNLTVFFALLGSFHVKAAPKELMKLTLVSKCCIQLFIFNCNLIL